MKRKKHALVLFTKYPEPGITKTRLMSENGGALTGEEAAGLYRAMVLDTADVGFNALEDLRRLCDEKDDFNFYISSSPKNEVEKIKKMFSAEFPLQKIGYINDSGSNFDEHFNDCYQQLIALGYYSIVCIGGDLPGIRADIVIRAFKCLLSMESQSTKGAMVLAPCQAAGVSLVGITANTPTNFAGVFYNADSVAALDALVQIAQHEQIPLSLCEALSDVDYMEDLGHTISLIKAMDYASSYQKFMVAPSRTFHMIQQIGLVTVTPPNTSHDPRGKFDD